MLLSWSSAKNLTRIFTTKSFYKFSTRNYKVLQVPILTDNYSHVLLDEESKTAVAIDPADPEKVFNAVKSLGSQWKISSLWITHWHPDHTAGNKYFKESHQNIEIIGSKYEDCPYKTQEKGEDDIFHWHNNTVKVIHTPCHTKGHISFLVTSPTSPPSLFCGDTLFVGGCGRFLEGSAKEMVSSLSKLKNLPKNTRVYCGHEYTVANLKFANFVDAKNDILKQKFAWAQKQVSAKLSTVPSTLNEELQYNPFLRLDCQAIQKATGQKTQEEVMRVLREMKNNYK